MKILLTLSYVGTAYMGYQLQKEKPTIALMLNRASLKAFGMECDITGCSRTDSGVHALEYCATVAPKDKSKAISVPVEKIPVALNTALPKDICVISAREVPDSFHPRYDVAEKEYVYRIRASAIRDPFLSDKVLEYGKEISDEAFEKMQKGARHFLGTHEFDAFMSAGSRIEDTTRTIYKSYFTRNGDIIEYHVSANGFLYNMVRIIVGTLLAIEKGKISDEEIPDIIASKNRKKSGETAKAHGLYLRKVVYNY